jgi:hypothetical protein
MARLQEKIDKLRAQYEATRTKLRRLEDEQFEQEALPAMRANVGKCFKYRNCYSCPTSDSDYWWMYCKVVGVRERDYRMLTFQIDQYGHVEIKDFQTPSLTDGYQPISKEELLSAVLPMVEAIMLEIKQG